MTSKSKVFSYIGFATKSGKLVSGYNSCAYEISRHKAKLLIIAEDISDNSRKKLIRDAENMNVDYRVFSTVDELSSITGNKGRGIYVIKDVHFAEVIRNEIDKEQEVF